MRCVSADTDHFQRLARDRRGFALLVARIHIRAHRSCVPFGSMTPTGAQEFGRVHVGSDAGTVAELCIDDEMHSPCAACLLRVRQR